MYEMFKNTNKLSGRCGVVGVCGEVNTPQKLNHKINSVLKNHTLNYIFNTHHSAQFFNGEEFKSPRKFGALNSTHEEKKKHKERSIRANEGDTK